MIKQVKIRKTLGFTSVIIRDMDDDNDHQTRILLWCCENVRPIGNGEDKQPAWRWERTSLREYSIKFDRESDAAMFVLRWS